MKLIDRAEPAVIEVTREELRLIASSIGEAIEALDDWDYPIRVGFELAEGRALLAAVNEIYRRIAQAP